MVPGWSPKSVSAQLPLSQLNTKDSAPEGGKSSQYTQVGLRHACRERVMEQWMSLSGFTLFATGQRWLRGETLYFPSTPSYEPRKLLCKAYPTQTKGAGGIQRSQSPFTPQNTRIEERSVWGLRLPPCLVLVPGTVKGTVLGTGTGSPWCF